MNRFTYWAAKRLTEPGVRLPLPTKPDDFLANIPPSTFQDQRAAGDAAARDFKAKYGLGK
jgi:hypothetical protein